MKNIKPAERLIVAADFDPETGGRAWARRQAIELAKTLSGIGVIIKLESLLRACGYDLIDEIHALGLKVFADLKLIGIPNTLKRDGMLLREAMPEIVTVMCDVGIDGLYRLKNELPRTEVLGVTELSSTPHDQAKFSLHVSCAHAARLDGIVASGARALAISLSSSFDPSMTINVPGIRPRWYREANDHWGRSMTPSEAIRAGADRIIVGRPILRSRDPYEATMRILEEMASVTEEAVSAMI